LCILYIFDVIDLPTLRVYLGRN